jgi:hypothetical protein
VMIDIHLRANNCSADICRTVCVGVPNPNNTRRDLFYRPSRARYSLPAWRGHGRLKAIHAVIKAGGHGDHIFGPHHGSGSGEEARFLTRFHGKKAPHHCPRILCRGWQLCILPAECAGGGYHCGYHR